ncbi:malonate decarboxylase holo-ACP synthase [Inquilinus limosus]|uniref:malonate decarboxylase holo-ACP synthase n=1 Tax=Inquilinus limosus TaxID=171674 RepID=UPI003F171477
MSDGRVSASPLPLPPSLRGGEADEAIQEPVRGASGLLRYARNDGVESPERIPLAVPFQPHDLLRIAPAAVADLTRNLPGWAAESLVAVPWVVVRRTVAHDRLLPVGIRGRHRSERRAAWLPPAAVVEQRTPEALAAARGWQAHPRRTEIPALAALDIVADLLAGSAWGLAGSVGFELATGRLTANSDSDLDIVLRAPGRIGRGEAGRLLAGLAELPVRVDVALETPLGACSLAEIAAGGPAVVKTPVGPRLVRDPWAEQAA